MSDNKFLSELSQNLLEILNDEEYYDITIEVGSDPNVKIFRAHMVILNYRSSYLRRILSKNERKNDGTLSHIKLPTISPEIFQSILRYIYGGKFLFEEYDTLDGIIKILVAANELNLQELVKYLQTSLIENNSDWIEKNFNFIYQTSFENNENNSFLELQNYCTDLISKEPDKIFKSLNFSSISEKILISLIQSDNLQMNEIQVWENVLKWGHAQHPELSSDPTRLSKDDISVLKNTLQHCIPFIRFYNLTSKEILDS
ncbi:BTB/POZ protein, partial [Rhizophagus irregularis DAOM 181602=DAOM 197198]